MSEKSDAIAARLRAAILCGQYEDGERINQSGLAREYGVHRSVIWRALHDLQDDGLVSQDSRHRFCANASYQTRQLGLVLRKLENVRRLASRAVTELTDSPIPLRASPVWRSEHAARERERLARLAAIKREREAMP